MSTRVLDGQASPSVTSTDQLVALALKRLEEGKAQRPSFTRHDSYHVVNRDGRGKVTLEAAELYEDTWINGRPYERLLERDGKTLSGDELAEETARYEAAVRDRKDLGLTERALVENRRPVGLNLQTKRITGPEFLLQEAGHVSMDGLQTRIVTATPEAETRDGQLAPTQKFTIWITDGPVPLIVRLDYEYLADQPEAKRGTRGEQHYKLFEGIAVMDRQSSRAYLPTEKGIVVSDSEHVYSMYRRFRTSVTIRPVQAAESPH